MGEDRDGGGMVGIRGHERVWERLAGWLAAWLAGHPEQQ